MSKSILIIGLFRLLLIGSVSAMPISHPDFQSIRGNTELKATATATWLAFIEVYDAALYVGDGALSAKLLDGPMPFSLELLYKVSLSKAQLIEGADVTLSRQHSEQYNAQYRTNVDALHQYYRDVIEGDRFRLDISDDNGLALFFNDELVYKNSNVAFAKYYIGLWLAENPLSDRVREGLLDW